MAAGGQCSSPAGLTSRFITTPAARLRDDAKIIVQKMCRCTTDSKDVWISTG